MKISKTIPLAELKAAMPNFFGDLVKAVVDVERGLIAFDAQLHVDLEQKLLESGSHQKDLWGINFYPDLFSTDDFVEFDSMINIRPSQNNKSRSVDSEELRKKIIDLITNAITQ